VVSCGCWVVSIASGKVMIDVMMMVIMVRNMCSCRVVKIVEVFL